MNWFHPSIWVQIEAACKAVGWPFSPKDIKSRLVALNPDQFESLNPQRFSDWIDKSEGPPLHFVEFVRHRIGRVRALEPGGHNSRIRILVSG